jgi:hypothetical protein
MVLTDIVINFNASAPGTTKVKVEVQINDVWHTILDDPVGNTDITYPVTRQQVDKDGAYVGWDSYWVIPGAKIKITVSASDALTNAVVVSFVGLKTES